MPEAIRLDRLARSIRELATHEGRTSTAIAGVDVYRADAPSPIACIVYSPCVIIVAQGRKRARVGGVDYDYGAAHYLVLPVSLPIHAQVLEADPDRPFLSFALHIEPSTLAELVDEIDSDSAPLREARRGIAVSETTAPLLDASLRLLGTIDSEADRRVLGPQIKKELLYRVLQGPQGQLLRAVGQRDTRLGQVARALAMIHREYPRPIAVAEMARSAHMSSSTFYEAFRAVTSLSPLQYLKEIRLDRARHLLLWEGVSAKRAATRVGYGSASQFSREFRRRFGRSPREERAWAIRSGEVTGTDY